MKDCVSTMCAPFDADEKSISLVELHKGMLSAMNELLVMVSFWLLPEYKVTIFWSSFFSNFCSLFRSWSLMHQRRKLT